LFKFVVVFVDDEESSFVMLERTVVWEGEVGMVMPAVGVPAVGRIS
jgi:hypothetical protein